MALFHDSCDSHTGSQHGLFGSWPSLLGSLGMNGQEDSSGNGSGSEGWHCGWNRRAMGDRWLESRAELLDAIRRKNALGIQASDPSAIKDRLERWGAAAFLMESDLERQQSPADIFRLVAGTCDPVSALILCHCESVDSSILTTSLESFDRHFAVNARASWLLIKEFAKQIPPEGGRILALTSDHTAYHMPYGASKGALDRIVLAAARELAHLNITANVHKSRTYRPRIDGRRNESSAHQAPTKWRVRCARRHCEFSDVPLVSEGPLDQWAAD